jgi:adenylate cyclase
MQKLWERLARSGASLAGLIALALVVIVQLADPAPLQRLRMLAFDSFQTITPRELAEENVTAIVDVDEESIERIGQWPWPRDLMAQMTTKLGEAGAQVVAFDMVFSEADRTSPEAVAARYQESDASRVAATLSGLPSHDSQFATSFAQVPVVTAFFLDPQERGRAVEPKASFTLHGSIPTRHVAQYQGSLQALPELEQAAQGNGFVSLQSDADGIVRRVPLVAIHRSTLIPSLSLEALRVARDAGSPNLLTSDGTGETLADPGAAVAVRIDGREIPVNDAGEAWVHFPEKSVRPVIPAWTLLEEGASLAELKDAVEGRIVYVGGSAAGLQDLVSTPQDALIAGVSVHAAMTEQMLAGHFLERPDWALGLELVLVIGLGLGLALALPRLGAILGALVAGLGIAAVALGSWLAFSSLRFLLDPTYPALGLIAVYLVQTVAVYYREEQQRSYIHAAFDRYLSPAMVRQIADNPGKLELGGEERDMSVMMCDVRGFSRISEQYSPTQVIDFLIEFLTPMSDILMERKATLDKYIGDAILAFWNAPLDDLDHHRNAARAALDMVAKLEELNQTMPSAKGVTWPGEVKIGIGLNSGICCVGNMGSKQRLNYSLIGDTVNVAARLEGLTKQYGVQIIAGEETAAQLSGFALFELDRVKVVGREGAVRIFVILGDESAATAKEFRALEGAHSTMLEAYRAQDWAKASATLGAASNAYEAFGLSSLRALFAERIDALKTEPLRKDWDGVFEATSK